MVVTYTAGVAVEVPVVAEVYHRGVSPVTAVTERVCTGSFWQSTRSFACGFVGRGLTVTVRVSRGPSQFEEVRWET